VLPVLVSVYRLGAKKLSRGQIFRKEGEDGFICATEVRITMIQYFASPGRAIDMLLKYTVPSFQISLVKIPSYNNFSLRICGFQFT
jgi:hypothetical protein